MTEKLLNCPFCGSGRIANVGLECASCSDCSARADLNDWNRRADDWRDIESAPRDGADYQQRRGVALDIIDEALNSYRGFMLDDDYDAQGALDRILSRMAERRAALPTPPEGE